MGHVSLYGALGLSGTKYYCNLNRNDDISRSFTSKRSNSVAVVGVELWQGHMVIDTNLSGLHCIFNSWWKCSSVSEAILVS